MILDKKEFKKFLKIALHPPYKRLPKRFHKLRELFKK
jgi:hypothetical protein